MNIRPVGADLFNANRKTDRRAGGGTHMTQLIVVFRYFANAHTK